MRHIIPAQQVSGGTTGLPYNARSDIDKILDGVPGATIGDEYANAARGFQYAVKIREDGTARALDTLSAAVLTGDEQKIDEAVADYAAAFTIGHEQFDAFKRLQADTSAAMRRAYADHARDNYEAARAAYNAKAAALAAAVSIVDPAADPTSLLSAAPKVRTAYLEIDMLAHEAEQALGLLVVAARLAGVVLAHPSHGGVEGQGMSLLVLDDSSDRAARRRWWTAWDEGHELRGGPLGALVRVGADIAAREVDEIRAYRRPEPIEHRRVPGDTPGLVSSRQRLFDPELGEFIED